MIAENGRNFPNVLKVFKNERNQNELGLNSKKTEVLAMCKKKTPPECNIFKKLKKNTDNLLNIWPLLSCDGRNHSEVNSRINISKDEKSINKQKYTSSHETKGPSVIFRTHEDEYNYVTRWQKTIEAVKLIIWRRMLRVP